jgi:hypothetical protein
VIAALPPAKPAKPEALRFKPLDAAQVQCSTMPSKADLNTYSPGI